MLAVALSPLSDQLLHEARTDVTTFMQGYGAARHKSKCPDVGMLLVPREVSHTTQLLHAVLVRGNLWGFWPENPSCCRVVWTTV